MDCVTRSGGCVEEIRKFVTLGEYSTAAQHVPLPYRMVLTFRWYIAFLSSSACNAKVCLLGFTILTVTALRFAKTTLHMPPSSLVLVGYSHGHTKCRYPLCATRADPATSTQSHVPACSHNTHHRHQRHATRRHQVVCIAWCAMGRTSASRDVRDRGIFRSVVRCIPERGLYTKSIPPDKEARWYGLTDKVCSCICPPARAVH